MRAVGLITEYNPFHNGHQHHLNESLKISGAAVSVAVMSGHFLQRGMPALIDKWVRTEMALTSGVDIVLELPVAWACNSAPNFADGAIELLNAFGSIDSLCFGSEQGELAPLQRCAEYLLLTVKQIESATGSALRLGIPYPLAQATAVKDVPGLADILATPNNILGINYLQSLVRKGSNISPLTIPRIGAGYHDSLPVGEIASATGLRHLYAELKDLSPYIPVAAYHYLQRALFAKEVLDTSKLFHLLAARLMDEPGALTGLYQCEDGIAERLCEASRSARSLDKLIDTIKVRHLTVSRIQRILAYILLNLKKTDVDEQLAYGPPYLRLLGSSVKGEEFLAATRKERSLPILGNLSRASAQLKKFYGADSHGYRRAVTMLQMETRATRLYTLLMESWPGTDRNRDYFEPVRRL